MVRYWCVTDDTALGALSLAFADAFAALQIPMRLIALQAIRTPQGRHLDLAGSRWQRHADAFTAAMTAPYTNVICGNDDAWQRLYTVGVTNVLVTGDLPDDHKHAVKYALLYERLIVTTPEAAERWRAVGAQPLVVPLPELETLARLREAVHP